MLTTEAPATATPLDKILQVLRDSPIPLTLKDVEKKLGTPKLPKGRLQDSIALGLVEGKIFECSPSGKSARYWNHDEFNKVREQIEHLLGEKDWAEKDLTTEVMDALGKVTSPKVVKEELKKMRENGLVHDHPGKGKTPILSLRPFDPLANLSLKAGTLKELRTLYERAKNAKVSLDRFLMRVGELIEPGSVQQPNPHGKVVPTTEVPVQLHGATQPLPIPGPASAEVKERPAPESQSKQVEADSLTESGEVRQLIQKAVEEAGDAPISVTDLRRMMPESFRYGIFDTAVWQLEEEGYVYVVRHTHPSILPADRLRELLKDAEGNYYVDIARRSY